MRIACLLMMILMTSRLPGQAGNIDNSFSGDGKLLFPMGSGHDEAYDVVVQPDGKILVAGFATISAQRDMAILRLHPDGTADNLFQNAGKLIIDIDGEYDEARQIALLPNGDIMVAGTTLTGGSRKFIVIRLDDEGELVTSFGDNGMKTIDVGSGDDNLYAMQILHNRIYLAGSSGSSNMEDIAVAVLDMNGDEVNAFSQDGHLTFEIDPGSNVATDLVVQPDGKILLTGHILPGFGKDMFVARITAAGEFDNEFNQDGVFVPNVGTSEDRGQAITLQPDEKILVAGYSYATQNNDVVLMRLMPNGSYDDDFGDHGVAIEGIGMFYDEGFAMVLQPDGKIIVAGQAAQAATDADFGLMRFKEDGTPDQTFSGDGKVITPIGNGESEDEAFAVALQPDGRLVVAGLGEGTTNNDFVIARYHTGLTTSVPSFFASVKEVRMVPNPVVAQAVLHITITEKMEFTSQLITADGRAIRSIQNHGTLDVGLHEISIHYLDQLSAGTYYLKVMQENGAVMMVPFVKIK